LTGSQRIEKEKREEEMTRSLKTFGMSLVAALALSATIAPMASAKFDSEAEVTFLHGEQSTTEQLSVAAGTVTCSVVTSSGVAVGTLQPSGAFTSTDLTFMPKYENCVGLGTSHVSMNGCTYTLTAGNTIGGSETSVSGETHIVCPGDNVIEITGTGYSGHCRISIPPQTPTTNKLTIHNVGSGNSRSVVVESEIAGIHYTQHGIFCPGNGFNQTRCFTNGTFTGDTLVSGEDILGNPKGIWVT
jgi:hypothetical protein